jgi:chemotaxis protein methyltransferase CheR
MKAMADIDIDEIEVRLLLDAIYARYGYDLRNYAPASLRRRVRVALSRSGFASLGELQHALLTDGAVFASVLDDLTVRVTDMFRDPSFYRAFRSQVVPHLRPYPLLRVWHAGCASGEEVYATAIVLREEGLYDRTQLYATDLSPSALQHAKIGIYEAKRAGAFTENYRRSGGQADFSAYYTAAYDRIAMIEPLRRNLLCFEHDLVSDQAFGEMQAIFCRNVLIYFGVDLKREVIRKLAASLRPGGFLCLGRGERLSIADLSFGFSEFDREERIYRYDGAAA